MELTQIQNKSVILYPIYLFDVIQTGTDYNPETHQKSCIAFSYLHLS